MRAIPLLAALLLAAPLGAAAGNCPVPMTDGPGEPALPFDAASPACRAAVALIPDFDKLRAAAGFKAVDLSFSVDPDAVSANAYYLTKGVWIGTAYLIDPRYKRAALVATLAHEIGHAVQDRDGQVAWSNAPGEAYSARGGDTDSEEFTASPEGQEYLARSRRLEAHADSIGQELMLRAGYPADMFLRGHAQDSGCQGLEGLRDKVRSHPAPTQRFVNAAMTGGALANGRARKTALELSTSLGGGPAREAWTAPVEPSPYRPAASLEDYEDRGRMKPGRRAAETLRVPLPPRDAGPVREHASLIAISAVDFWIAEPFKSAVNRLTDEDRVSSRVLAACGKPQAAELNEDFSAFGWAKRVAADAARRLAGAKS